MIPFIGEVSGEHRTLGKVIAHHGEIVRFTIGDIIQTDGDTRVKIVTDKHAPNYGTLITLWLSNIILIKENK